MVGSNFSVYVAEFPAGRDESAGGFGVFGRTRIAILVEPRLTLTGAAGSKISCPMVADWRNSEMSSPLLMVALCKLMSRSVFRAGALKRPFAVILSAYTPLVTVAPSKVITVPSELFSCESRSSSWLPIWTPIALISPYVVSLSA